MSKSIISAAKRREKNRRRIIREEELDTIYSMMSQLTQILLLAGITEVKISKKTREIYFDTEDGGMIDPQALDELSSSIDKIYFQMSTL